MKPSLLNAKLELRKTTLALALACGALFMAPAHAQALGDTASNAAGASQGLPAPSADWASFNPLYSAFVVAPITNYFYAINTHLAYIKAYLLYGTLGPGGDPDVGTGLIGTMKSIWTEQRLFKENLSNQNSSWNRRNELDAIAGASAMNRQADPRNCSELGLVMGARASPGGGSGANSKGAKGRAETQLAARAGGTQPNDLAYAATIYTAHKPGGYCSAQDATLTKPDGTTADRGAFGCTASDASSAKMPDADARSQSILRPAYDYTNAAAVAQYGHSLTFNNGNPTPDPKFDQAQAAKDAIANIVTAFSPPSMPKEVEQTTNGKLVLAKIKVYNGRVSPAIDALTNSSARLNANLPGGTATSALSKSVLADFNLVFGRLFPSPAVPPTALSEAEILRYEVLRRYADLGGAWIQTLLVTDDAANVGKIRAQTHAVKLQLLYNFHERQQETNALLSSLLAQSVNPLTKRDIEAAVQNVTR